MLSFYLASYAADFLVVLPGATVREAWGETIVEAL
jgi:hypothetical protein